MATTFRSVLDNAFTTTAEALDDSELGIDVTDGSVFPLTVDCPCILTIEPNTANMEKVLITANAANVLTVDASGRGYEGSVAKAHDSGVKIELLYVATHITELQEAVNALENGVVNKADFNATTFLYATSDDTPQPKTPAEVMAILSGQAAATFSMNTQKISGVVDPTADQEAATKKYVDDRVPSHSFSITVESPGTGDTQIPFSFTNEAITITEINAVLALASDTPSVTWAIYHDTSLGGAGNSITSAPIETTNVTTGHDVSPNGDPTVPVDSRFWIAITARTGTVGFLTVTLFYTVD